MIRRTFVGALAILLLLSMLAPALAQAQTSGAPEITLVHQYRLDNYGSGILNDTITFTNNGTSTEQIPSVQLGIPDNVSSHAVGFYLDPSAGYRMSSNNVDNVMVFTISPVSPSLAANSSSAISLKSYLTGILNITAGAKTDWNDLLLLSPSLNTTVNTLVTSVDIPESASFDPIPSIAGTSLNSSLGLAPPRYELTQTNVVPKIVTENSVFNDTDEAVFLPVQVYSVVRTIVPSTNSLPLIQDQISFRNLAYYNISSLPLALLDTSLDHLLILPSTNIPTINPTPVNLTNHALTLTDAPFSASIAPGDNFTFTLTYTVPSSLVTTTGTTVTVSVPNTMPVATLVQNYTVRLDTPPGVSGVSQTLVHVSNTGSMNTNDTVVQYRINAGWAADQAVPAGALFFIAALFVLMLKGPSAVTDEKKKEEEGEEAKEQPTMLADILKALEDKLTLIEDSLNSFAGKPQGAVAKPEFQRIRTELDSLKTRAFHRLGELRQSTDSKGLRDVLNQIQEAERNEDRAAKDILNLYEQYQTRRMREETFQRLLPGYKRRLSTAVDTLSDLLNQAQKESVEG